MITIQQALIIAEEFVKEACEYNDINYTQISIETKPHPQIIKAFVDLASLTLTISELFLQSCCENNSFTPLRSEMYSQVRKLYFMLNPSELKGGDIHMESLYYAFALMLQKGLQLPILKLQAIEIIENVKRVFKSEFNLEVDLFKASAYNGMDFYMAHMSDREVKRYVNRYFPLPAKSTITKLSNGDKGTKENPFDNIYEAVEFIRKFEFEAHSRDCLLQEIEQAKYFYDFQQRCFRIHWASPHVSQYSNNLPSRSFMVNQMDTGCFSFKPNLYRHKFLYRGQSDHYEGKPCVPNLFRSQDHNAMKDYLEFLIFSQEMELLIMSHPLVRLLDRGVELLHDTFRFRMHTQGLAQHYYNKSHFLDLTSDLEVMKFFATTDYNWKTDSYSPHTTTDELGVIYCYELQYPTAFLKHEGYALKTIGKQMFMRPGSQCGFLLEMGKDIDLKTLPEISAVYFYHDAGISNEIFTNSNSGYDYFATDLLQHAWQDRYCKRRNDRIVSKKTVEYNAQLNNTTIEDITQKLTTIGIQVDDMIPSFKSEELDMYYASIPNGWWDRFCDDIHFYGAEDELYRQALKEIKNDPRYKWAFTFSIRN